MNFYGQAQKTSIYASHSTIIKAKNRHTFKINKNKNQSLEYQLYNLRYHD